MTFSYHIDYKLGSTVKTATGSNEDLLLQVQESDHRLQVTLHPTAPIQVRSFILELLFTVLKVMAVTVIIAGSAGLGLVTGVAKAYIETTEDIDPAQLTKSDRYAVYR
ncbi:MAG: hypothetical protein BHV98_01385 [Clostridium sp. CAG:217_53_7]|nr:MAG: hypothetical protein BHV98_01385 [Clostridium sp. CAG:217_53_7]